MSTVLVSRGLGARLRKRPSGRATLSAAVVCLAVGVWASGLVGRSLLARRVVLSPSGSGYEYHAVGNPDDVTRPTRGGFVLEGGGTDIDDAFRWMIERSGGGDFLVIRSTGTDAYNDYVYDLTAPGGERADSVATLVVKTRAASSDPFVVETVRRAEALWIAGGDQARHLAVWRDTPVADAIHELIARGVPVGGTSSGLAVLGPLVYAADSDRPKEPHLTSTAVLRDPFDPRLTLRPGFLRLPYLADTLLEPHFVQESRHGRMAAFLSRLATTGACPSRGFRGLGIERKTALLVEPDGSSLVITHPEHPFGTATLLRTPSRPRACEPGRTLSVEVEAVEFGRGDRIDLSTWTGRGGKTYRLLVEDGTLTVLNGRECD